MVNVLQFIIYMNQWKLNWPPNANLAVKTLRTIALGEFIDTKKILNSIIIYYSIQAGNQQQQADDLPVELNQDPQNSGRLLQNQTEVEQIPTGMKVRSTAIAVTIIIFVVVALALAYTVFILYHTNKRFKTKFIQIMNKIKVSIFWNGLIRFYLQSFLKNMMAIFFVFFHPKTDSNSEKGKLAIQVALAIMILIVIPFMIQRTLRRHKNGLFLQLHKNRIGSLYLGIKTQELDTIFCVFSFLLVRLFFVILTYSSESIPGILVNLFMLLNNFNIIYIGWFSPYDTSAQNNIELFNSFMMQIISYHLLLLANLLETPLQEYNIGWSIIACIGIFFVVNMGYMTSLSLSKLFRIIYLRILKNRAEKLKKQKQEDQEKEAREPSNMVEVEFKNQDVILPTIVIPLDETKINLQDISQNNLIVAKTKTVNLSKRKVTKEQAKEVEIKVQQSLERISEVNESVDEEAKMPKRIRYLDPSDRWDNVYVVSNPVMVQYINVPVLIQQEEKKIDQVFSVSDSSVDSDSFDSHSLENQTPQKPLKISSNTQTQAFSKLVKSQIRITRDHSTQQKKQRSSPRSTNT